MAAASAHCGPAAARSVLGRRRLPAPQPADRSPPAPRGNAGGVALRAAGPQDLPALQGFVEGLSPTSRSRRFFTPRRDLPPFLARALTERDARHRFVVAVDLRAPLAPVVALAQYARLAARPAGELALVVGDA